MQTTSRQLKHIRTFLPDVLAFEAYLPSVRRSNGRPRYTQRTVHSYAVTVNGILSRGQDPLDVLREHDPSPHWNTIRSAFLAWAAWKNDARLADEIRAILVPAINYRETKAPSSEVWDQIMREVWRSESDPRRSILLLLMGSGLRIGEIFLLSRSQVSIAVTNKTISISQKGRRIRDWTPSDYDRDNLRRLVKSAGWHMLRDVFDPHAERFIHPWTGKPLTEKQHYDAAYAEVRKAIQDACQRAGVEYVRPHRYRHACAHDIIGSKGNIIDVQRALGHSDSRTTDRFYLHSDAERQADLKNQADARHRRY